MNTSHAATLEVIGLMFGYIRLQMRLWLSKDVECLSLQSCDFQMLNITSIIDNRLRDAISLVKGKVSAILGGFTNSLCSLCST
jgi:hypothetical protein